MKSSSSSGGGSQRNCNKDKPYAVAAPCCPDPSAAERSANLFFISKSLSAANKKLCHYVPLQPKSQSDGKVNTRNCNPPVSVAPSQEEDEEEAEQGRAGSCMAGATNLHSATPQLISRDRLKCWQNVIKT